MLRRRGECTFYIREASYTTRQVYLDKIDEQKEQYQKDFLNDPNNIQKAASYAKPSGASIDVLELVANSRRYIIDEEKAEVLIDTFFPTLPLPEERDPYRVVRGKVEYNTKQLPLTKNEVERAIFKSSPDKVPSPDEISFYIQRELQLVVGDYVLQLYNTSLELQYTLRQQKIVRIVTLRKPGKADYTILKAFCLILLLPTISKGLEVAVTARLSFITETYNLLLSNYFRARPCRSTKQALNVLVEKIYQVQRQGKVLSLVSFDIKGVFTGVYSDVLERQLEARQVPILVVQQIRNFCNSRHA